MNDIGQNARLFAKPQAAILSARETECLLWAARGLRSKEIAEKLNLSNRTVEHYIAAAMRRLATRTRGQAVATAISLGCITP